MIVSEQDFLKFHIIFFSKCVFLITLISILLFPSSTGSVALQSSNGGWSQLLHSGPWPCRHAPPWHRKGPVRAHPWGQGPHHGTGPHHPGDCTLQSRCLQQGQKSNGLLRPQKVSSFCCNSIFKACFFVFSEYSNSFVKATVLTHTKLNILFVDLV